jgi:hyperosmotically inducible periplasmic protein
MNAKSKRVLALCAAGAIGLLGACSPQDRAADGSRPAPTADTRKPAERAADNTKTAATDTAITAKVKSALLADAAVKGTKIDVDTSDGTVTLSGTASSPAEKAQAEKVAASVEGVRNVVNRINVS